MYQEFSNLVDSKFHAFNATNELQWAWNAKENIILYGPGGYGKSDVASLFGNFLYEKKEISTKPFVMAFGQGMTEDRLLGGLDIKKFQNEGELVYLLKNAFIQHELVIFEELWDAFPNVLLVLKDILQSKQVRMGNSVTPIKTKCIIACTNRSRDEVVSDNSTAALMERFLFEKKVTWESWLPTDFTKALSKSYDSKLIAPVASILAESSKGEYKISPRTAYKAMGSVIENGLESLNGIYGITVSSSFDDKFGPARDFLENIDWDTKSAKKMALIAKKVTDILKSFDNMSFHDWEIEEHNEITLRLVETFTKAKEKTFRLLKSPTKGWPLVLRNDFNSGLQLLRYED